MCYVTTFLAFFATELLLKCEYLLAKVSRLKSLAGKRIYGSAYIQTVSGFQLVTRTHYLKSNFLHFTIKLDSMYFYTIYWVSIYFVISIISTRFLNRQIPLPRDDPAGFIIQILRSPSIANYGNFFFN